MPAPFPALSRRGAILGALAVLSLAGPVSALPLDWQVQPVQIMMVSSPSCYYCRVWWAEIGPGFAASPAGRMAPLFEVDVAGPFPDGLVLDRRPRLTPTFIVLDRGTEIGRVEGYVGQRYFYPVLEEVMRRAGLPPGPAP